MTLQLKMPQRVNIICTQQNLFNLPICLLLQGISLLEISIFALIIQLVSGAIGGNVAGSLMKNLSLGILGNSITGIVGGGLGGQLLSMQGIAASGGGMDIGSIVVSIAGGGVGGGVLLAIIRVIKKALGK